MIAVAAGKVRSDRDHTVELMAYYEGLLAARRGGAAPAVLPGAA
jgi:alpha-1,6-mannosyltransferase